MKKFLTSKKLICIVLHLLVISFLFLLVLKYAEEISDAKLAVKSALHEIRNPYTGPETMADVAALTAPVYEDAWFADAPLIHHAGGALNGNPYTNSREAIEASLAEGSNYLEIDFRYTSDGHLVCVHDWWDVNHAWDAEYLKTSVPTLEEFLSARVQGRYTPLTAEELIRIMAENPQMYLITDVKGPDMLCSAIADLVQIAQQDPDILDRFIIQLYAGREKSAIVKSYPFRDEQFLFTLYEWGVFRPEAVQICYEEGISVITSPFGEISAEDAAALRELGYTVYEHTVNRIDQVKSAYARGIAGFYTDYLSPEDLLN